MSTEVDGGCTLPRPIRSRHHTRGVDILFRQQDSHPFENPGDSRRLVSGCLKNRPEGKSCSPGKPGLCSRTNRSPQVGLQSIQRASKGFDCESGEIDRFGAAYHAKVESQTKPASRPLRPVKSHGRAIEFTPPPAPGLGVGVHLKSRGEMRE